MTFKCACIICDHSIKNFNSLGSKDFNMTYLKIIPVFSIKSAYYDLGLC